MTDSLPDQLRSEADYADSLTTPTVVETDVLREAADALEQRSRDRTNLEAKVYDLEEQVEAAATLLHSTLDGWRRRGERIEELIDHIANQEAALEEARDLVDRLDTQLYSQGEWAEAYEEYPNLRRAWAVTS